MKDKLIIQHIKNNDNSQAIQLLYESFVPIRKFIKTNGGNEEDAKDIFQDSLMVFYQKVKDDDAFELTCSITTYLFSICKYKWKDRLKQKNKIRLLEPELIDNQASMQIESNENLFSINQSNRIQEVLKKIGDNCLEILKSYYIKRMSMQEIAKKMNYASVNTAKTRKYKCLEKAKKMLQKV